MISVRNEKNRSENITSIVFTPSERFRVVTFLIIIIDKLTISLMHRLCAYEHVNDIFGFLRNLKSLNNQGIVEAARKLHDTYPNDLEDTLLDEMVHFSALLRSEKIGPENVGIAPEFQMNLIITHNNLKSTFPNIETLLKMYLCMMVTNCSGERSFSTLKRVKNHLRSTMSDQRLNMLSLMNIESQLLRTLDFDNLIFTFASKKARKQNFSL